MSGLVEWLRAIDHSSVEDCFLQSPLFGKAADEITRLTARVAELEGALRPFAEIETSDGMPDGFLRTPDGHAVVFNGLGKDFKIAVTVGDVRRARTALEPKP